MSINGPLSMAFDDMDRPHIIYEKNYTLWYAYKDSGVWYRLQVDPEKNITFYQSIAVDSLGHPHIAYSDWNTGTLRYASFNGTHWTKQVIRPGGACIPDIKANSTNVPHIVYIYGDDFVYARREGLNWVVQKTIGGVDCYYPSLDFDKNDNPHFTFADRDTHHLYYGYWNNGSGWIINSNVSSGVGAYSTTVLKLDSNDYPHVLLSVYFSEARYTYYDGSNWITMDLGYVGGVGGTLVLDKNDLPHLGGVLSAHTWYDGDQWIKERFYFNGAYGSTLNLDSNDIPHHACNLNPGGGYTYRAKDHIPPVAVINITDKITEGDFVKMHGLNSTDNIGVGYWNWTIEFDSQAVDYSDKETNFYKFLEFGNYTITLNVMDYANNWNKTTTVIMVKEKIIPNTPPEINHTVLDFSFDEDTVDTSIDLNYWFSDYENDPLNFSYIYNKNISITVLPNDHVKLVPLANWSGWETLTFTANDTEAEITDYVKVTITNVNDPPVICIPPDDVVFNEDTVNSDLNMSIWFKDIDDNDDLVYSTLGFHKMSIVFHPNGTVDLSPDSNWSGNQTITFSAHDGDEAVYDYVNVAVLPINDAPDPPGLDVAIIDANPDTSYVRENLTAILTITAPQDIDGDRIFKYSLDLGDSSDNITINYSDASSVVYEHTYDEGGEYDIRLTVEDEGGLTNSAIEVGVKIVEPPTPILDDDIDIRSPFKRREDAKESIEIKWTICKITILLDEVDSEEGTYIATTEYRFEGTCGISVDEIHLYSGISYYGNDPVYNPICDTSKGDGKELWKIIIEPKDQKWSYSFSLSSIMNESEIEHPKDSEPQTEEYWYGAIAWDLNGNFNIDEIKANNTVIINETDDEKKKNDDGGLGPLLGIGIPVLVFLILLLLSIAIAFYLRKTKPEEKSSSNEKLQEENNDIEPPEYPELGSPPKFPIFNDDTEGMADEKPLD